MSTRQDTKTTNNGTSVDTPTDLKPSSARQTTAGRFFEMMCVLCCAASTVLLVLGFKNPFYWIGIPGSLVIALLTYKLAIRTAVNEVTRQDQLEAKVTYKVNTGRLRTLELVGVPADVIRALESVVNESPVTAEEFLGKLTRESDCSLSRERMKQWQRTILKYTRVDDLPAVAPASNGSQAPVNARAKN